MKKLNIAALLLGAALFTGMGASALNAENMKCGAGKCGKAMEAPAKCCPQMKDVKKCDIPNCTHEKCEKKCNTEKKEAPKCGKAKK